MNELVIKYLKNNITSFELDYIEKSIPKRFSDSLNYKSNESKSLSLLSGIIIYNNLKVLESDIKYNKLKKPYIENGPFFNVSHSKDMVVFVKSIQKIGIDIEYLDKKNLNILNYAFDEYEKKYILDGDDGYSSIERLTKLWTIKESLFKASGSEKYIEPKNLKAYNIDNDIKNTELPCIVNEQILKNEDSEIKCEKTQTSFLDTYYNTYSFKVLDYFLSVASIENYDSIRVLEDRIVNNSIKQV